MDNLKNLQGNEFYGVFVVLVLLVLFLVQVGSWVHLSNRKEGFDARTAGWHPATGGPPGASYHALNDHTGSSGDYTGHDRHNYSESDMALKQPELYNDMYAPESFLNSRFPGPEFADDSARMISGLTAPLYAKVRSHEQQLAGLTHAVNPNEIVQGGSGAESYISEACNHDPYSNPASHHPGAGCGGSHSFAHDTSETALLHALGN